MNMKDKDGNPFPFNIDAWTCNRYSKSGGKLRRFVNAKLLARDKNSKSNLTTEATAISKIKKNPQHFQNRTRNIELKNGNIRKIHIRLIDSINGKKVQY